MYGIWDKVKKEWGFKIEEPTYWKAHKAFAKIVGPRGIHNERFEIRIMRAKARGFKEQV